MGKIEYKSELINYELDSIDELYFLYWLEELNDKGLLFGVVKDRYTYPLNEPLTVGWGVEKDKVLIKTKTYTPDFIFKLKHNLWYKIDGSLGHNECKKNEAVFYRGDTYYPKYSENKALNFDSVNTPTHDTTSELTPNIFVDVKGAYTKQFNSSITFPDRQAMLYNYLGIYVNKVIVFDNKAKSKCLFAKTFTPKKVIDEMIYKRDTGNNKVGDTKIKYKIITIDEYLTRIGILPRIGL